MGKSLRSKIERRWRKLRRGHLDEMLVKPKTQEFNIKCEKALAGIDYREKESKNAFLHPDDPEAEFPQYRPPPIIDLRANSIPGSGLEYSGACRRKTVDPEHVDQMRARKKNKRDAEIDEQQPEAKHVQNNEMKDESAKLAKKKKKVSKLRKTFVF